MKYRFGGKEKRLAFGVFPTVTLAEAREMRNQAKKVLAAGGDPGVVKKEEKAIQKLFAEDQALRRKQVFLQDWDTKLD